MSKHVVILGAGLAGLACAYELAKAGERVTVLEREEHVGGMASSFIEEGVESWSYDFGPHRFHTRDEELKAHVREVLNGNCRDAKRLSRIVLFNRFFDYPLKAGNVLRNLPTRLLVQAFLDYAWVRFKDVTRLERFQDDNFETWVTRRFGRTLYRLFFGQYTEKAWGMPPSRISADWASQRISLLSLADTVKKTLFRPRDVPRTLVTDFIYPDHGGIGELARGYTRAIRELGGTVLADAPAVRVHRDGSWITRIEYGLTERRFVEGDAYVSTIPITALARSLVPPAPPEVRKAIASLRYISIVFIYLKVNKPQVSPDNWLYLPEKHLTVHRISEFKNFSPNCAPSDKTMVCAEITCRGGDEIWRASVEQLRDIAVRDLESVGLLHRSEVLDAFVKKIPYAYPVYDVEYRTHLMPILEYVHTLENIRTGGRQGLFRYNNMDQSVEMGRRMAWSILQDTDAGHEAVATGEGYFG